MAASSRVGISRVCIVGVGLIGGSVAKALQSTRKTAASPLQLDALVATTQDARLCRSSGLFDAVHTQPHRAFAQGGLMVLATPVSAMQGLIEQAARTAPDGSILTDVASVKQPIAQWARQALQPRSPRLAMVPAHPIAGSHRSGLDAARLDLLDQRLCILCPSIGGLRRAAAAVRGFWTTLGMHTFSMSPQRHDALYARISHLPHMLSSLLAASLQPADARFAGAALRDMTRLALSPPEMWADIALHNAAELIAALQSLQTSTSQLTAALQRGHRAALLRLLRPAATAARRLPRPHA